MIAAAGSAPFFILAVFFAIRSWNPLGNGYFSSYPDSPDGLYLTMAGIGLSVAGLFAALGLVIVSRWFRVHGGFVVIAALAGLTSALPYVLFKWTSVPETWPWAFLIQDQIGWLRFEPRPRFDGIAIQIALGLIVATGLAVQVARITMAGGDSPRRGLSPMLGAKQRGQARLRRD